MRRGCCVSSAMSTKLDVLHVTMSIVVAAKGTATQRTPRWHKHHYCRNEYRVFDNYSCCVVARNRTHLTRAAVSVIVLQLAFKCRQYCVVALCQASVKLMNVLTDHDELCEAQ